MTLIITRTDSGERGTFGSLHVHGNSSVTRTFVTLELPWRLNASRLSCIPAGTYALRLLYSRVHGLDLWHVCDVPERDNIPIHMGNFLHDVGDGIVIACGIAHDRRMVVGTQTALQQFMALLFDLPEQVIVIHDAPGWTTA